MKKLDEKIKTEKQQAAIPLSQGLMDPEKTQNILSIDDGNSESLFTSQ